MVRLLRAVFKVPLAELARLSGVGVRELHRIERGEVLPTRENLKRLDDAFHQVILDRATKATEL